MEVPTLKAIRSKPLIKIEHKRPKNAVQKIEDLDFGYMEELNRKKMFMMCRLGHIRDQTRSKPLHTYKKIPVLPIPKNKSKKKETSPTSIQSCSPNKQFSQHSSIPTLSQRQIEDPYLMEITKHRLLGKKQRRLNVINNRIRNKFQFEKH